MDVVMNDSYLDRSPPHCDVLLTVYTLQATVIIYVKKIGIAFCLFFLLKMNKSIVFVIFQ